MKYMVVECHLSYAVVLGEDGCFRKVANMRYEPGQMVTEIFEMEMPENTGAGKKKPRWAYYSAAAAACLMIAATAMFQAGNRTFGSIYMTINPNIRIDVNKKDLVVGLEGLNQDGQELISHYEYRSKKLADVTGELADLSIEEGYLTKDGAIWLDVRSSHEKWKQKTQQQLLLSLDDHFGGRIRIIEGIPEEENPTPPESEVLQSETTQSEMPWSEAPAGTETPSSPESAIVPVIPETKEAPAQDVPADDTRMDDDDDDRDEDDDDDNPDDDDGPEDDDDSDDD